MKHQPQGLDAEGEAQEAGAGEATLQEGQSVVQSLYLQGVTERATWSFTVLSEW